MPATQQVEVQGTTIPDLHSKLVATASILSEVFRIKRRSGEVSENYSGVGS